MRWPIESAQTWPVRSIWIAELIATTFGPQAASLREDLQKRLQQAVEQIDAIRSLDDLVEVNDEQISEAITLLLERSKLLVEGAGACGLMAQGCSARAARVIEPCRNGAQQRGRIVVETRCDGDDVLISVTDSGGGIPESVRHRIFEPFFTTKEVGKGTGQGLAIANSVVRAHGGSLSFQTEMGIGTTFLIRLPIKPVQQAEQVEAA